MLGYLHRLRQDEEGQTLVLGAITMFVLALAVMSTLSIGQAAYEKIKLQNTADATVYSIAATQARVFNFFAYSNRSMIAHYHSMLTFVSYLSYALYIDNTLNRIFKVLQFIPYIGVVFKIISKVIDTLVDVIDWVTMAVVPALNALNVIYFLFQGAMWLVMQAQVIADSPVASLNDPDADLGIDLGDLNAGDFLPAFAKGANLFMVNKTIDYYQIAATVYNMPNWDNLVTTNTPTIKNSTGEDEGNEARIIMSDLINNARHNWVAGSSPATWSDPVKLLLARRLEFDRGLDKFFKGLFRLRIAKNARTEHGLRTKAGVGKNSDHDQIYAVDTFEFALTAVGVTYSVTYRSDVMHDNNGGYHSENLDFGLDCGDSLIAKAACKVIESTVTKLNDTLSEALSNISKKHTKKHYYIGITPYMKFNPNPKWRMGFNQPDYIVFANKPDDKLNLATKTFQRKYKVDYRVGSSRVTEARRGDDGSLDLSIAVTDEDTLGGKLMPGFNAIAVARVYYHRPGEWKEHPNFFNPFWAAKLHPVAHHQFFEFTHLANFGDEIITH